MFEPCLEVAVFDGAPTLTDALHREVHRTVATFDGYLASVPLRGVEEAATRADLVLWTDEGAAKAAAARLPQIPELARFVEAIAQIRLFHHYTGMTAERMVALAKSPLVEILAATRGDQALRTRLHTALERHPEVLVNVAMRSSATETPSTPGDVDVVGWTSQEAMMKGPEHVMAIDPGLAPLFQGETEPTLMARFAPVQE